VVTSVIGVVVVVDVVVVVGGAVVVVVVWHKDESETTVPSGQTYCLLTQPETKITIANNANKIIIFIREIYFPFLNNFMIGLKTKIS